MASSVTNRFAFRALKAALEDVVDVDMLLVKTHTFNPDSNFVSNLTTEVTTGEVTSYVRQNVTIDTTAQDDATDRADVTFTAVAFGVLETGATVTGAYLFNNAGGADTARELLVYVEFAAGVPTNGSTFTVNSATEAVRATVV